MMSCLGVFDFRRRAAVFFQRRERAEVGLQFLVIFRDGPRQKTAQLARVIRILAPGQSPEIFPGCAARAFDDVRHKIVAQRRQRGRRQAVKFEVFQIQVMIRSARHGPARGPCRFASWFRCASGRLRRREMRCGRARRASARTPENSSAATPAPVRSPRDGLRNPTRRH